MPEGYEHQVTAWWSSGRGGFVKSPAAPNSIHVAAPPQFGGLERRWTPEELLLGAMATCFMTTFRILAEKSRFDYLDLEIEVKGRVQKQKRVYRFTGLVIAPRLKIPGPGTRNGQLIYWKGRKECV